MFAVAAALLCEIPVKDIRSAVRKFKGLEHRQEIFGTWEDVTWINDSKSTSLDAVRTALEAFEKPLLWIAGGRFKGGDFESLRGLVSEKVKEAHFYGEAVSYLSRALKGACPVFSYGPLLDVIESLKSRAKSGDTVLLSPGCSSFDQFKNFEERGKFFKEQVNKLYALVPAQV
jgi:UDP-N-acetylmuramoylalanine--D-glutamate ligase